MNQQPLQKTADTPETAQQLCEEGLVLMKHEHYADALSCFEQVLELDANHVEAWFRIGCCRSEIAKQKIEGTEETLYVDGEFELYEGAIKAYQKAIELQPDYTSARRFLAELFTYFGEMQSEDTEYPSEYMRAIEWYKQAIEVYPDLTDSYYKLAEAYTFLMEGKEINDWDDSILYDQAGIITVDIVEARIEIYQKLTEIQPDDAKAYYELGEAYSGSIDSYITLSEDYGNETQDEIEAMKQSKHPEVRAVLEKAKKAYRTAIGIKPYYAGAYSALGGVHHRLGQFEEAIQAFKQAIVLDNKGRNNLAEAYHELGKQYFAGGNYMQAIECYNNAIVTAFRDDHNEVYYDLAVANDEAGHYELAIWCYRRVRSAYNFPSDMSRLYPELLCRLGTTCHRCGHYQDAVEAYQKAINRQIEIEDEFLRKSSDNLHYAEPLEYPEWWTEVSQNLESASRHEPL